MSLPQTGPPMDNGARKYLLVAVLHFGIIGVTILAWPQMYGGAAFVPIVRNTPLLLWGLSYLLVGILCAIAAITKWPKFARAGLILAFIVLMASVVAVGWGVVVTWFDSDPAMSSPLIPISFAALAFKDLLVVGRPFTTPDQDLRAAKTELEGSP
jgi:hypothetical protein